LVSASSRVAPEDVAKLFDPDASAAQPFLNLWTTMHSRWPHCFSAAISASRARAVS
jgi:hypothetical protein